MREVFSDENRVAHYLAVEAVLARAQGQLGIIPPSTAGQQANTTTPNSQFWSR